MATRLLPATLLLGALACGSSGTAPDEEVAVTVRGVALDPVTSTPVMLLEDAAHQRQLPIWIGLAEARSIAQQLENVQLPRPNTHDLAKQLIDGLEGVVQRVVVTDLRDGTYYAVIEVNSQGRTLRIDSRPSDAVAIALRVAAPVFVRVWLFEAGNRGAADEQAVEREI